MKAVDMKVGQVVVDSLPFSQAGTLGQARVMMLHNVAAFVGYLGVINKSRLDAVMDAGLGFIPVTLAGEYKDGPEDEVGQLKALGLPPRTTVFLDVEGMSAFKADPPTLIAAINAWADRINACGFIAGLYLGNPQPLTEDELWALRVTRYWKGQGACRDRFNKLAEPRGCGWCMVQYWPSAFIGEPPNNTWVDYNMVGQDYKGRTPTMVVR
jgi:hypothetical protein